jgi:oxygen-independent coproporphyrinogen-3 oxidase
MNMQHYELPERKYIKKLTKKYEKSLPRYTSYPTAPQWHEISAKFEEELLTLSARRGPDLSLYIHIPFCEGRCLFCGCNTVISRNKEKAVLYLEYLQREMELVSAIRKKEGRDKGARVKQMHFGGGTPTFLTPAQFEKINELMRKNFTFAKDVEYSVEIDPEVTTLEHLDTLKKIGVNRISIGVQDFNEEILIKLKRPQKNEWIEKIIQHGRKLKFSGINIDLIYGLPGQDIEKFNRSLEKTVALSPERIALFSYAHVPWVKPHQKALEKFEILSGFPKFELFLNALEFLGANGYTYVGLDHFAKKNDPLNVSREKGKLHRNFQGYTTQGDLDMLSFGVSSISSTTDGYWQNPRDLKGYNTKLEKSSLAAVRGHQNSLEDMRRKKLILDILCHGRYQPANGHSLADDILGQTRELKSMAQDGLVEFQAAGFTLTNIGQLFSRNVAALFDSYLVKSKENAIYSKTI